MNKPGIPWIEPKRIKVPLELLRAAGGDALVARTLAKRGFVDSQSAEAFLNPDRYSPASPEEIPGMIAAVDRIEAGLLDKEGILVWGDFDVDGQTSTTLLVSALRELGLQVEYHIPVRAVESHGVNIPVLERLLDEESHIGLIVTCDTGIAAHEAIDYAQGRGIDVIVTDHHELPDKLPAAKAVVNSNLCPEGHPLRTLPGVGVAYKLVEALFNRFDRSGDEVGYLDLVALGVVADVARQVDDTRYLLQRGLKQLRSAERLGLRMIMQLADLDPQWLTEEHIGFRIAPRLNALGRLSDANPIVELLTTTDEGRARTMAYQLEGLNSRRQMLTSQVYRGALALLERQPTLSEFATLVLAHKDWPSGVIGIVASRIVERFHKPTILISLGEDGIGRASARSVEGIDITAAIASQKDLLLGFGGHAMAAGFSIMEKNIELFRRNISQIIESQGKITSDALTIDAYLTLADITLDFAKGLEQLAPYGAGNPPLTLACRDVRIINSAKVGRNQEHLLLTVEDDSNVSQKVVWWSGADVLDSNNLPQGKFDLAFHIRASTFRGQRDVQIQWLDFRLLEESEDFVQKPEEIELVDYRDQAHPLPRLAALEENFVVWAEGESIEKLRDAPIPVYGRHKLRPVQTLVIWSAPPSPAALSSVLDIVLPKKIVFFAIDPHADDLDRFLIRLAGLVKYAIRVHDGKVDISTLAALTAQTKSAVRIGLDFLAVQGNIIVLAMDGDSWRIGEGKRRPLPHLGELRTQLVAVLDETRAYRAFYTRTDLANLLSF